MSRSSPRDPSKPFAQSACQRQNQGSLFRRRRRHWNEYKTGPLFRQAAHKKARSSLDRNSNCFVVMESVKNGDFRPLELRQLTRSRPVFIPIQAGNVLREIN